MFILGNMFEKWDSAVMDRDPHWYNPFQWYGIRCVAHSFLANPFTILATLFCGWMWGNEIMDFYTMSNSFTRMHWTNDLFMEVMKGFFPLLPFVFVLVPLFIVGIILEPIIFVLNMLMRKHHKELGSTCYVDLFFRYQDFN